MSQLNCSILTASSQVPRSQASRNPITEFFKVIVRDAGIKLSSTDDPNSITQEQALVVRDLDKLLDENYSDDCIEKFLRGFKLLIKKEKYLKKALLPTLFKKPTDENGTENDIQIQQESLFRIFLKTNHLQSEIIDILLEEITSTVSDDHEDTSWLRLLLSQLRYLPHIKKTETLTTKLLDIMDIAPFPSQLEILDSIPDILPDSEYNETAKQLGKMLDNEELSGAIIDCLNALDLDQEIRAQVQDHVLAKMLTEPSVKLFPVFLDFLMTDHKNQDLSATLVKIRTALDNIMASTDRKDKEKESGKIVIFNRLQTLATSPKIVAETWLNVVSRIKVHTDHKPVDLLILFMLHSSARFKKRAIETTFRKRVKDGLFKCTLLEKLFDKYMPQQLLRDYFASIVEIGSSLLRSSNDVTVIEFASTLFKLLFNHEHTETVYRQELLDSLILLAGASDQKNVTAILNIFNSLLDDITRIQHHTVLLMRLLEKLHTFDLKDVKLVFDILCTLTCSDESLSGLKEEIHMIVRKQLGSSKRSVKHRGIVSAVVMAKHVATNTEEDSEAQVSEDSILSVSHLKGRAKEAAAILELAKTSTSGSPEFLGLYYDQLGSVLMKSEHLDKNFLAWLYETVTNDFQNVFVTETVCPDMDELQFSMQYNINSEDEMDTPLAVNIAELTLKGEKSSILILAPHFRLLRLLHYRQQNGDLSSIDALLGCGVVLPKTEQRDSLSTDQLKQMVDCLFHCINWFREVISGFVTQKSKKLRQKVVQRMGNLIELENILDECLESVPGHNLPHSYFDAVTQINHKLSSPQKEAPVRPRKKLKTRSIVEDSSVVASTSKRPTKKITEERTIKFREMDIDVIKLIIYPLNTTVPTSPSSDQTSLTISQLNFILKDFAAKLTLLTKSRDLGLSHLNAVAPVDLMNDCKAILLSTHKHFVALVKSIEDESESTEMPEIKTGFGLILEILWLIFSWSGFQHTKHLDLLRDILKAFRPKDSQSLNSVNRLTVDLVNRLSNHSDHCAYLSHAVYLITIMEALYSITPGPEIRKEIAKTSGKLLSKHWTDGDSTKNNATNIDVLIKAYLSSASIKTLCGLVGTLQEQAPNLKAKKDTLPMLESVDKSSFYIFYRNLWACLHDRLKTEIQSLTNHQHLTLWRTTALTMQGLMTVAKMQETKSNLVCFLKKSIAILKIFLSHGIPIMEIMLRSKPDEVVEIFKIIQSNTRFLHHLCCYSKLTKDSGLMAHVPQFRLVLETLVYRVKATLVANGCSAAFWMGNLKNRDLQGEDILTQSTENTTSDNNEEEEETLLSDDDEDIEEEEEDGRGKSGSEVFD